MEKARKTAAAFLVSWLAAVDRSIFSRKKNRTTLFVGRFKVQSNPRLLTCVVRIHDDSVSGLVLRVISSPAEADIGMRIGRAQRSGESTEVDDEREKKGDEATSRPRGNEKKTFLFFFFFSSSLVSLISLVASLHKTLSKRQKKKESTSPSYHAIGNKKKKRFFLGGRTRKNIETKGKGGG